MERPYKFVVICNKTGDVVTQTNTPPLLHSLKTWEPTDNPNIRVEVVTRTVYEDMRYEAKLRLWKYVTFTKKGLPIPKYRPYFEGPILNF